MEVNTQRTVKAGMPTAAAAVAVMRTVLRRGMVFALVLGVGKLVNLDALLREATATVAAEAAAVAVGCRCILTPKA